MQDFQDSFGQQNNEYYQLHKQCDNLLQNINLKHQANRQWIAKSYRKLNQFILQNSKLRFNLSNNCSQLPQIATKYAFSIQPFQFSHQLQSFSKQMEQSYAGKKKCEMPLIYRSQNNQWTLLKPQNGIISIKQNNRFNLRIQAQQKSYVVITRQNNHPLRVKPQLCSFNYEKATFQIVPPSSLSIVVIKQQSETFNGPDNIQRTQTVPFKLPSNCIKVQINTSGHKKGRINEMPDWINQEMMVRPQQTFNHELSNSQNSNLHAFVGIQTQSRSRD